PWRPCELGGCAPAGPRPGAPAARACGPSRCSRPRAAHPARGTAGRQDGVPSPRRSAAGSCSSLTGLPNEESHGLLEDLALFLGDRRPPRQLPQLLLLLGRQPVIAPAGIAVGLPGPVGQAL